MRYLDFTPVPADKVGHFSQMFSQAIQPAVVDSSQALIEVAELSFYEEFNLYRLADLRLPAGNDFFLLASETQAFLLDDRGAVIREINSSAPLILNKETVGRYTRFYFDICKATLGVFTIVEEPGDVIWLPEATEADRQQLAEKITPLFFKEKDDDFFCLHGTILFQDALWGVDIRVAAREVEIALPFVEERVQLEPGMIDLSNREPVLADLPVLCQPLPRELEECLTEDESEEEEAPLFCAYDEMPPFADLKFKEMKGHLSRNTFYTIPDTILPPDFAVDRAIIHLASLPFYDTFCLFAFVNRELPPPNIWFMLYPVSYVERFLPMNCTNEPIYTANEIAPIRLTPENLPVYVKFFFFLVRGRHGTFVIVEKPEEVRWLQHAGDEEKAKVNARLEPVTYEGLNDEGLYILTATVIFRDALFKTEIQIAPESMEVVDLDTPVTETFSPGQVRLANEELLFEDLNVKIAPSPGMAGEEE